MIIAKILLLLVLLGKYLDLGTEVLKNTSLDLGFGIEKNQSLDLVPEKAGLDYNIMLYTFAESICLCLQAPRRKFSP